MTEVAQTPRMSKLDEALGLFPSVIKCGEQWSPTCQAALEAAKAELAALRGVQPSPLKPNPEAVARIIYDAFPFEPRHGQAHKPEWIPGGNSIMQDRARQAARAICALWSSSVETGDGK